MARKKTPEERLEELQQQKREIQAQVQRERQKLKEEERKRDTRRKVLIGSKVLEHARKDSRAARYLQKVYGELSERDQQAFEGFEFPDPQQQSGQDQGAPEHPAQSGHSTPGRQAGS